MRVYTKPSFAMNPKTFLVTNLAFKIQVNAVKVHEVLPSKCSFLREEREGEVVANLDTENSIKSNVLQAFTPCAAS